MQITKIPATIRKSMQQQNIWSATACPPLERLKLLQISHYNFQRKIVTGQIIILDSMALNSLKIFQELFSLKFPINSLKLIDEFAGNDELSMEANNSSGFNFRTIANSNRLSMHAYGLAIDLNPQQNPIVQDNIVAPISGRAYLDRSRIRAGMVEPIVDLFAAHGFDDWGGAWQSFADYHHFQPRRDRLNELL